jgi:2-polyprenyl-3-methyl-5-hydroxy-6-metoxy-1,4-benzoquinol methylase
MFKRPKDTYLVSKDAIPRILRDNASPLNHIARLIPEGSTVLDIGAGNGLLGQIFQGLKKSVFIDGIEPNEYAAKVAGPYYRSIFVGFSHEYLESIKFGNYDYLVLADVVEHTVDPAEFLEEICACLSAKTKLFVSLPNVAFGGQRLSLFNGSFNYVDSGLLEKTHLRFFTIDTAKALFASIPLSCDSVTFLNRSFYRTEFSRKSLKAPFFQLLRLAFAPSARAYQYLFVLHKGAENSLQVLSYGAAPMKIIFDAFFYRPIFKKTAKFFIEFFRKNKLQR